MISIGFLWTIIGGVLFAFFGSPRSRRVTTIEKVAAIFFYLGLVLLVAGSSVFLWKYAP